MECNAFHTSSARLAATFQIHPFRSALTDDDPLHLGEFVAVVGQELQAESFGFHLRKLRDEHAGAVGGANGSQALDSAAKRVRRRRFGGTGFGSAGALAAASLIVGDGQ